MAPDILILGGSDTGRAPMAAALLQRVLLRQGLPWQVASAGVVGHDGEAAQPEARNAMLHLGLTINDHLARSADETLLAGATLLLAIDSGTARVLRARFPALAPQVATLGELAGQPRDIPDPFRMQIGAWIAYAREIDGLLLAALPALQLRLGPPSIANPQPAPPSDTRAQAIKRLDGLLRRAADPPEARDWNALRQQLISELAAAATPNGPADLAAAYGAVLRSALGSAPPDAARLALLRAAVARLHAPITSDDIIWLAAHLE